MITISLVNCYMAEKGWTFAVGDEVIPDNVNQKEYIYQIYPAADPEYFGRATVQVLWDKKSNSIVSNESSDMIRMLNFSFGA